MDRTTYWKNFKLGTELDISGKFIYNGLQSFHEMRNFIHEEEIFEFLYYISVGIERLLKIAVILIEHDDTVEQDVFEKELITHNHGNLLQRVKKKYTVNFSKPHNEFLSLLSGFYKTSRYGRYNLTAMTVSDREKTELINFLNKALSLSIDTETLFQITPNDKRIKKFVGKIIGKISEALYKIIIQEAGRLNIYTYEIRHASKAEKIFLGREYDFEKEDILRRELLLYFVNSDKKGEHSKIMKSIKPLSFDPASEADYIGCFFSSEKTIGIFEELEALYEDVDDVKERKEILELIGNPDVYFDSDEDDEDDEDWD